MKVQSELEDKEPVWRSYSLLQEQMLSGNTEKPKLVGERENNFVIRNRERA